MTNSTMSRTLAATAAVLGLLLLAPVSEAHAKGGTTTASAGGYGYTPKPVIRDHRANPTAPFSLPLRYHRHNRRGT